MLKLIIKDFALQRKILILFLIMIFVFIAFFSLISEQMDNIQILVALPLFITIYSFASQSIYTDEKNGSFRLLAAMPIKRKIIVQSKYIAILVFMFFILCFYLIIDAALSHFIDRPANSLPYDYKTMSVVYFSGIMIMLSIYLPLVFKLGYRRASIANLICMICIMALLSGTTSIINEVYGRVELSFINLSMAVFGAAIIYTLSMYISVAFFEKRNLFI